MERAGFAIREVIDVKRTLTIKFEKSVSSDGTPDSLEVVLVPMLSAASTTNDSVLVGSRKTKNVLLNNDVLVKFDLVPTHEPGLTEPVFYRLAWRQKFMGRIFSYDFAMPDQDVNFSDLYDLDAIITGESYLWVSDLGKPGRVAQLNSDGDVMNALGVPIPILTGEVNQLTQDLAQEVQDREQGDQTTRSENIAHTNSKMLEVRTDLLTELNSRASHFIGLNSQEASIRAAADIALNDSINSKTSVLTSQVNAKADLVNGKVPSSQLPSIAVTDVVVVANEAEMLALTTEQVQRGDIAMRPDSAWILSNNEPFLLSSWVKFNLPVHVSSVNGQTGEVVLSASSVGARSTSTLVPLADVQGLANALSLKADASSTVGMSGRLDNLEAKSVFKDNQGLVPTNLLRDDVPLFRDGQIVTKDGRVIAAETEGMVTSVNGNTGDVTVTPQMIGARPAGNVLMSEVTGLVSTLNSKVDDLDLATTLTRMAQIETDLDALGSIDVEGVVQSRIVVSYFSPTSSIDDVDVRSPFGINSSGNPYYSASGAAAGEGAFPYITPNGNLELRKLDPDADPDPELAKQEDLQALSNDVGTIARKPESGWTKSSLSQHVQDSLDKADISHTAVTQASSTLTFGSLVKRSIDGRFEAAGPTQDGHVANKAYVDQVAALLTPNSNYSTLVSRVGAVENALPQKASLDVDGKVVQDQMPNIEISKVNSLEEELESKPTLTGGKIPVSVIPTGIPKANISNLETSLAAKADLVGGKIPTSQIPKLATHETVVVVSRAEMLALTEEEIQRGDIVIIRGTADVGSYIFGGPDHANFEHWIKMESPGAVMSINGQTGTVTLTATDVQARPAATPVPMADISGLASALNLKASKTELTDAIATVPSFAQVDQRIVDGATTNFSVKFVATTPIGTLSGLKTIDGSTPPGGTRVLLTAEAQSQNNGVWVVSASNWTRPTDMPNGASFFPKTTLAVTEGATHAHSMWQLLAVNVGLIGTNGQSWQKVLQGGLPKTYTAGNGIQVTGTQISAKVGDGLVATTNGIELDPTKVMRKFAAFIPSGSTNVAISHNLGTTDVSVSIVESASGDVVLAGVTVTTINTINIEFETAPQTNQYRVVVFG
jgi:hypothetical protein